jgi:hypothetical protein
MTTRMHGGSMTGGCAMGWAGLVPLCSPLVRLGGSYLVVRRGTESRESRDPAVAELRTAYAVATCATRSSSADGTASSARGNSGGAWTLSSVGKARLGRPPPSSPTHRQSQTGTTVTTWSSRHRGDGHNQLVGCNSYIG